MVVEILLVVVVLAVAVLTAVDMAKTPSESPHGQAVRQAHDAGRAFAGVSRGTGVTEANREPGAPGILSAPPDATAARLPESVAPAAGSREPGRVGAHTVRPGSSRALEDWRVGSRLWLLVGISAVAAAVAAFCAGRIVGALHGSSIDSPVSSVRHGAITSAIGYGVALVIVLALAAWFTIAVARSVLRPLGRLRAGVVELPDVVRRISEGGTEGRVPDVKPVGVDSSDELGEVARAFDEMRVQTLRMAAHEASVRGTLSTMFTSLSRRSQSLVERQIRLIEGMEQGEQDPGRLASLSEMDRIAARMHRSSQNLLVLAGHELPDRWNQPVALVGVIRAAMSEIEDHERVSLTGQPDIAVRGPAVNDVAHLLAELAENATSFSAGHTPVHISSKLLNTGGALIEITDRGVGMAPKDMAEANWQLENAQAPDVNVPKWVGLFVVARLAARHGIRVRLQPAEFAGVTALVWLPDDILTRGGVAAPPRFSEAAAGAESGSAGLMTQTAADPRYAAAGHLAAMPTVTDFAPPGEGLRHPSGDWPLSGAAISSPDPARHPSGDWPLAGTAIASPDPARHPSGDWPLAGTAISSPDPARHPSGDWPLAGAAIASPDPAWSTVGMRPQESGTTAGGTGLGPQGTASANPDVIVPPAERNADHRRLPIFDEMESRWFAAGLTAPGRTGPGSGWTSPADAGWQAAQAAELPTSSGSTPEGLPRRTPAANLIPGAIPGTPPAAAPTRSAAEIRDRLTGFQRGISEGRAAAGEGRAAAGESADQAGDDQA